MTFADLLAEHKAQLGKVAARFTALDDADFKRHLVRAGYRLCIKYPLWKTGEISLTVGIDQYPAPPDILGTLLCDWGRQPGRGGLVPSPWDAGFIGYPPSLILEGPGGGMQLRLSSPPSAAAIASWGSVMRYRYLSSYRISEDAVDISETHRPLVMLAALIEAMRELSAETATIQLQKGLSGLPTAGTPAYLHEKLCLEFDRL
jgi:hypothetical protein